MSRTIRFRAEVVRYAEDDPNCEHEIWETCLVEMSVDPDGRHDAVYDIELKDLEPQPADDELLSVRGRVGRVARHLERIASELHMLSEGMSDEESSRTLAKIEKALGIGGE